MNNKRVIIMSKKNTHTNFVCADAANSFENPQAVFPVKSSIKVNKIFEHILSPISLNVIRIKTK